jgi:[protein-PII] uridylyltransferase
MPAGAPLANPTVSLVARWRRTLAEGRSRLHTEFEQHSQPAKLLRDHTKLVDNLLKSVWQALELPATLTLTAVGGYGRGELYPYSDVDLLILLPDEGADAYLASLEPLIGVFWDIGLEVGSSVRSVTECLDMASQDITVQTNLMEGRFLCGSKPLFQALETSLHVRFDSRLFFEAKLLEQQQRHARFHDTAYNLEPNLKESPGGLRDLQNILWIARGCGIAQNWGALVKAGIITATEARQVARHERNLAFLRIALHYLAKRREDRLLFDFQDALAKKLGLKKHTMRRPSEMLMQRYYRTAKAVTQLNIILLQNLRASIFSSLQSSPIALNQHFQARGNLLEAVSEDLFLREPATILESFLMLQRHPELKDMSATTLRALWRARGSINAAFRRDSHNRDLFMAIMREPSGITRTLRRMNLYGVLGKYLPAFGSIVGRMQHDLFHVYTVDEHILTVVRNLRRFTIPELAHEFPLCSRLMNDFDRPEVLYIAALFHDVAKGRGGDHSTLGAVEAVRFCQQHGLSPEDKHLVAWLVANHLVMSATAQKKDLSDPEVIAEFARHVDSLRNLTAIYLLTVADIRGTSPTVWNAWKGKLLGELYGATQRYLAGSAPQPESRLRAHQEEALQILRLYAVSDRVHEALWKQLDDSYFMRHEAQEIAWHTRLLLTHTNTPTPIVRARLSPVGEGLQVMIYTRDRDDLFARICGFFERINYNILDAKIYTTRHGYALDSFQVMDESNRTVHYRDLISYVEFELTQRLQQTSALEEPLQGRVSRHLKHFPIEPEVSIHPDEKGIYHVLSVTAGDRPGLLSRIAQVFLQHGIRLHMAKIATLGHRAEDTFIINGNHLDNAKAVLKLETDLLQKLQT